MSNYKMLNNSLTCFSSLHLFCITSASFIDINSKTVYFISLNLLYINYIIQFQQRLNIIHNINIRVLIKIVTCKMQTLVFDAKNILST